MIVAELTGSITHSIELLLVAVLLAMALALGLVFRGRPRLLPLAVAVLAVALTFGALAAVGASLTVAQVAVLPVLVGLAVDYAVQFQSRVQEARAEGAPHTPAAIRRAATAAGPTIAAAAAAGAAALLVMMLSPVPTVRGFALLLVVGIAIALLCALTSRIGRAGARGGGAGRPPLSASPQPPPRPLPAPDGGACVRPPLAPAWRGAQEMVRDNPLTRLLSRAALVYAVRNPGRVIAVGLALAVLGWGLDTQTHVETNLEKLVPQSLPSLHNLDALEGASGVGGEIDLMVSGKNVASPKTIEWMGRYQDAVLKRFGYTSTRGCGRARLAPPSRCRRCSKVGRSVRAAAATARVLLEILIEIGDTFVPQLLDADFDHPEAHRRRGERPAADDPRVLFPERDHRQPAGRHARVRHPPDAA